MQNVNLNSSPTEHGKEDNETLSIICCLYSPGTGPTALKETLANQPVQFDISRAYGRAIGLGHAAASMQTVWT